MRYKRCLTQYPLINIIFEHVKDAEEAVFLDSSSKGELGRYSIIACSPYLKLVSKGDTFTINGEKTELDYLEFVKHYLEEHKEENETDLPIISGAVGYFSYDFGRKEEGVKTKHSSEVDIPDSILYFYDMFIVEDHADQILHVIANGHTQEAREYVDQMVHLITEMEDTSEFLDTTIYNSQVLANFTRESYMEAVDHMIRYIVDGDIYVVNMTQQLQIKSNCPPYEMFRRLRRNNPSPFGGYFDYGDFQIVCASPERFMQMKDGKIKTRPIKGTRKRGKTQEEDQRLKKELAESEKDQSELLMIVDLERNDLNRVCLPGSVKVTELFSVETYATVFHLVANVEGLIRPDYNAVDLLSAAFPGGSITGAPKLRAMELIDQEEHLRRNLYTGSIGYLSLNGDCDLNIVIRTGVYRDGIYHLGVGGGITYESDLEFEYEETWQKAKALLDALNVPTLDGEHYEYTVR